MQVHVLNGDALAQDFEIDGQVIIMREALIEGPVDTNSYDKFWKIRSEFHSNVIEDNTSRYQIDVQAEFEKLKKLRNVSAVNLWFDHDLFCQVNMWFVVDFLNQHSVNVTLYRVMPPTVMENIWSGFGKMNDADLRECYRRRQKFQDSDIRLCIDLWNAYRANDLESLKVLSSKQSPCFPLLSDAVEAHLERFPKENGRPQKRLREILKKGQKNFHDVFSEFVKTEGVYGFGDLQVKRMLQALNGQKITEE
jgi:hypothetical protein